MADLTRHVFDMDYARLVIEDQERQRPVVFGSEGDEMLGTMILVTFSLWVDTVDQKLVPITARVRPI